MASRWYSKPSPFCAPLQFMKKPLPACAMKMATAIVTPMPKAETRERKPVISPSEPPNSARIARNAKTAGMCSVPVKKPKMP